MLKSWEEYNPEYLHLVYDDRDIRLFMELFAPKYLALFDSLGSVVERADLWRYLVLYSLGERCRMAMYAAASITPCGHHHTPIHQLNWPCMGLGWGEFESTRATVVR